MIELMGAQETITIELFGADGTRKMAAQKVTNHELKNGASPKETDSISIEKFCASKTLKGESNDCG